MEAGAFSPVHIGWAEALLRVAVSFILPLLIGLERYLRKKPVDFRPFVIISVAACGLSMATMELAHRTSDQQLSIDPTRVFAGVITGIGFLGAGSMFREERYVKGAGSAAAIWAAGAIGILSGIGLLWLAALVGGVVLALLLVSGPFIEKYDSGGDNEDKDENKEEDEPSSSSRKRQTAGGGYSNSGTSGTV